MIIIITDNSMPFPKILVSLADAIAKVTLLDYFPCCNNLLISSIGLTDDEMINSSRSNILEHNSPKRLSLLQFASEGTGDKSSTTISFVFRFTFKETRQLTSDTKKYKGTAQSTVVIIVVWIRLISGLPEEVQNDLPSRVLSSKTAHPE